MFASNTRDRIPSVGSIVSRAYRFVRRWPIIPVAIVVLLVLCAAFAGLIAPHDPERGDLRERNVPPLWSPEGDTKHILGTDPQGRDILSRIIFGARISLIIAAVVLCTGGVGGTLLGLVAGYAGGFTDELIMRLVDITLAIPFILVAMVVVIVAGQSFTIIVILLIAFSWNAFARQVRAETLQLKTADYVALATVAGASTWRIMFRHILPGVTSTLLVIATLRVGQLILTESILSFLGVGIPPPTPAWGVMIADGRSYLATAWWVAFFPGMAIFLTVLAFNFLGDWLRDWFDPRLRQI